MHGTNFKFGIQKSMCIVLYKVLERREKSWNDINKLAHIREGWEVFLWGCTLDQGQEAMMMMMIVLHEESELKTNRLQVGYTSVVFSHEISYILRN